MSASTGLRRAQRTAWSKLTMAKIGTPSRREAIFHQNAFWPQDGPNSLPEVPKRPEMASRRPRDGRKMGPNSSKDGPKMAQNEHRVSTRRSFLSIVSVLSIRRCFHAFSKKRASPRRGAHFGRPLGQNLSWGAPDGTSFSSWVPRRAQEAPRLPPRHVQSQKGASPRRDAHFSPK